MTQCSLTPNQTSILFIGLVRVFLSKEGFGQVQATTLIIRVRMTILRPNLFLFILEFILFPEFFMEIQLGRRHVVGFLKRYFLYLAIML